MMMTNLNKSYLSPLDG